MKLEAVDQDLLDGKYGEAAARAMALLHRYGTALAAEQFVSIQSAHIDACLYHGRSSLDFVAAFMATDAKVRVPTTLNVSAADLRSPQINHADESFIGGQRALIDAYEALGCVATLTCAPYQRLFRPRAGDHIAWAESNAIVFANSVLGARTDRYGDFADLCAALTGRVPLVGLHRPENRKASLVVDLSQIRPRDGERDRFYACLGYRLGLIANGRVPVLTGLDDQPSEDELKALGASAASSGSIALFHIVGVTPEAPSLDAVTAAGPLNYEHISDQHIADVAHSLCRLSPEEKIDAVCLGTPHFSLAECSRLTDLVSGRRKAPHVELIVSTSREIADQVETEDRFAPLRAFGVRLIVDTCTYFNTIVPDGDGALLTNSGKWAHYAPGALRRRVGLMTLEDCVTSVCLGRVAPWQ